MDYPLSTPYPEAAYRRRVIVSPLVPAAIVALVLTLATVVANLIPDTRDVTARHGTVPLRSQAL